MIKITLELEDGLWVAKSTVTSTLTAYSETKAGALEELSILNKKWETIASQQHDTFKMVAKLISETQKEATDD